MSRWLDDYALDIVQSVGVVVSLLLATLAFRNQNRSTKVSNLLQLTSFHRDIWKQALDDPDLLAILNDDNYDKPISQRQRVFVNFYIQNINAAYQADSLGTIVNMEGMAEDVGRFMGRPVPLRVWAHYRPFQNKDFAAFVDKAIKAHGQDNAIEEPVATEIDPGSPSQDSAGWQVGHIGTQREFFGFFAFLGLVAVVIRLRGVCQRRSRRVD